MPTDPGARVITFGETSCVLSEDGSVSPGGPAFDVAWHLCGFGGDPLLLSALGDDQECRRLLEEMEAWGLSTGGIVHKPTSTAEAWSRVGPEDISEGLGAQTIGLVFVDVRSVRDDGAWEALRRVLDLVDARVLVDLHLSGEWSQERVDACLDLATWVRCDVRDLEALTGQRCPTREDTVRTAVRFRRERSGPALVVTRRAGQAFLVSDDDQVSHADVPGKEVRPDTEGSRDAFTAVLCRGILHDWEPPRALRRAADFAADAAALESTVSGDLTEYERHLRRWADGPGPSRREGDERGLYVLSLSVHGLVRGTDIELGRDADTGGQVSYVVDQARALAAHPRVDRVDLVTRLVQDRRVDDAYARPTEPLAPGARIIRIPFGPRRYLRKESLWPHLDSLLDQLTRYIRAEGRIPDVIHGHYADAGYVGAQLSRLLGVPFIFTGHSLGRVKKARLLSGGGDEGTLDERYRFDQRFEAEELALETAALVITSTRQEVREQYESYDRYDPGRMEIIPPGVDLERFGPPSRFWTPPDIVSQVRRFLTDPAKPVILALARADDRKNFQGLLEAYAATPGLRERANLVLIAGNRDDIREMDAAPRRVLNDILYLVDRHDLYGSVAYPKHHRPDDVPDLYRMAAQSRGLFVNPALTEPFGLTLIEAAASGLPVVATNDGGPRDILEACGHGLLADPLDTEELGATLLEALSDRSRWARWSKSGVANVHERFSWKSHARRYVGQVDRLYLGQEAPAVHASATRLPRVDRILVTDLDDTLTGDDDALAALVERLAAGGHQAGFGLATGRSLERALELMETLDAPEPDFLLTASGTELHYGKRLVADRSWDHQIHYRWRPEAVEQALSDFPGVGLHEEGPHTECRLRYQVEGGADFDMGDLRAHLRREGVHATPLLDHERFLDVIPLRASPGLAIRFLCFKWDLPPERLLVAGDSGNDVDMLTGDTLGVVVANHTEELESLRGRPRIHFADRPHAWGVLDGIEHYRFLGDIRIPDEEGPREELP